MSDRLLRLAIGALALAGAAISAYILHARLAETTITCSTSGCETVQSSRYAEVLGVPVAALGLLGYGLVLATTLSAGDLARTAGVTLTLGALGFSAYLLAVQLVAIGAVCDWCLASDGAATALAALALLRLLPHARRP